MRASSGLAWLNPQPGQTLMEIVPRDASQVIVAQIAPNVRRLCSVCTGAFLLAAAGQLDGGSRMGSCRNSQLGRLRRNICGKMGGAMPSCGQPIGVRLWGCAMNASQFPQPLARASGFRPARRQASGGDACPET